MPVPSCALHPDRLLPADPGARAIARRLYEAVRDLPLSARTGTSTRGCCSTTEPFADPATLFVTPDHYVTRLLHASGVPLEALGVGQGRAHRGGARGGVAAAVRRTGTSSAGTPVRYWLEAELAEIFDVTARPSAAHGRRDPRPARRPARRATTIRPAGAATSGSASSVLATTDDPCGDLAAHARARRRPHVGGTGRSRRSGPTATSSRPEPGWRASVARLGEAADVDTGDYAGYVARARGAAPVLHRARGHLGRPQPRRRAHRPARPRPKRPASTGPPCAGEATAAEAVAFRRHMVFEMARMSCDDGLIMTLHPGVRRNHHGPTAARFGPDTGHDLPLRVEFTDALRPLLERFGTHPGFHLVRVHARRDGVVARARAAGRLLPVGLRRRARGGSSTRPTPWAASGAAVTETAGFTRTSGFVDDTRAFCSIPARHDLARRVDAGVLAHLVAEHRLDEDEALETAVRAGPRPAHGGVQAVTAAVPDLRAGAPGPAGRTGAPRAPGPRHLLPCPPGLVHRPGARCRGDWGIAAFGGRGGDAAPPRPGSKSGALHAASPAAPSATAPRWSPASSAAHAAADHDGAGWRAWPRPTSAWSRSRSPRPATAATPREPRPDRPGCRPTSPRCAPTRAARSAPPPARLVAGLAARRRAGGGPIALVPCDNLPATARPAARRAPISPSASTRAWRRGSSESVASSRPSSTASRPRTGDADVAAVERATGWRRPVPRGHRAVQRVGDRRRRSPLVARRGRTPAPRFVDDVDAATSSASSGC